MKKYLSLYILFAFLCAGLQSCLYQEDNYFDDSSANRATADVAKCSYLLKEASNGWKLEYYVGRNYALGGVTLLCKFDGQYAKIASQGYDGAQTLSSLYKVVSEQATMLTFDSYNPFIHQYGEPGRGDNPNSNLEGDYEFIIMEASADKIVLQGKRYQNLMVMTALPADFDWAAYINDINRIEEEAFFEEYALLVGGNTVGSAVRSNYVLTVAYQNGAAVEQKEEAFLFTPEGLRLRQPMEIAGKSVQNFKWNLLSESFSCTDNGSTDVVLKGVYPEGYVTYADFIGEYIFKCEEREDKSFVPAQYAVSIVPDVENKSYILKGLPAKLKLTYNRAKGTISFKVQNIPGKIGNYYFAATVTSSTLGGYYPSYLSFQYGLMFGFNSNVISVSPFAFSFVDDGIFASFAETAADSWVFHVYSSDAYDEASYLGWASWYQSMTFTKVIK